MKKKLVTLAMVSVLMVSLVACGNESNNVNTNIESNKVNVENDSTKNDTESSTIEQTTDIETTDKEENKPDYTVVDVSYTKYTNATCSIRDYPGVSGEEVGILAMNTKVNVIGECNNGWLKIEYKDTGAFIRALYLSDVETITE